MKRGLQMDANKPNTSTVMDETTLLAIEAEIDKFLNRIKVDNMTRSVSMLIEKMKQDPRIINPFTPEGEKAYATWHLIEYGCLPLATEYV